MVESLTSTQESSRKNPNIFHFNNQITIDSQNALGPQEFLFIHVIVAKVIIPSLLLRRVHICTNVYVLFLEENLWNSIFVYYYHVCPSSQTGVDKLCSRLLYLFRYFTSSQFSQNKMNSMVFIDMFSLISHCVFLSYLVFCLCNMITQGFVYACV